MADRPVSCVSASKFLFQNLWTPLNSAFASTNEDMLSWSPSIPKLFEHVAVIAGPFVDMIPAILAPLIAKRLSRWADNVSEKAQAVATLLHVATHHYTLPSGAIVDDSRHSRHFKTLQDLQTRRDFPGFSGCEAPAVAALFAGAWMVLLLLLWKAFVPLEFKLQLELCETL